MLDLLLGIPDPAQQAFSFSMRNDQLLLHDVDATASVRTGADLRLAEAVDRPRSAKRRRTALNDPRPSAPESLLTQDSVCFRAGRSADEHDAAAVIETWETVAATATDA